MPTREELEEAIEQLEHQPTSFENCMRLAIFYQLHDRIQSERGVSSGYKSDTEFMRIVENCTIDHALEAMDELVECLKILNPRLYNSFMKKLQGEA